MSVDGFLIREEASIRDAVRIIDENQRGIVLVVDKERRLVATVTDGDVRRAMLANISLDEPLRTILARKGTAGKPPLTAPLGTGREQLRSIMQARSVRHIPLVDSQGGVVDLVSLDDLFKIHGPGVRAVVMAGGFGTRLLPLTEAMPKPMLPVGDRPLLERILENLRASGIHRAVLTTHYKPEVIRDYFGNGQRVGMDIRYVHEETPLGTAGALSLIETPSEPLLVVNGDILTNLDYRTMIAFHEENRADMTVAAFQYEINVPYGVVETKDADIVGLSEKPRLKFFVNAGIYLLEPDVHKYVPSGRRYDMPDLIAQLISDRRKVVSFPIREYWLDIGQHADYQRAQSDVKGGGGPR